MRRAEPSRFTAASGTLVPVSLSTHSLQDDVRRVVEELYGPAVRKLPGLDIGRAYWGVAKEFQYGGDLVDVFHYADGTSSLAVVDISGHGIEAARHAGLAKYALRAYASRGFSALEAMRGLNRLCIENSAFEAEDEFFATAFFGLVDRARRCMRYVAAGHDAAYLIGRSGSQKLDPTGPILGLSDDPSFFGEAAIALADGDLIAAATDGFSEARNGRDEFLGVEALADVVTSYRHLRAEEQAEAVIGRAVEYAGAFLHDDVAALVVKVEMREGLQ